MNKNNGIEVTKNNEQKQWIEVTKINEQKQWY